MTNPASPTITPFISFAVEKLRLEETLRPRHIREIEKTALDGLERATESLVCTSPVFDHPEERKTLSNRNVVSYTGMLYCDFLTGQKVFHGKGELFFSHGLSYRGFFYLGKEHGKGSYYSPTGALIRHAVFENGIELQPESPL